MRSVLRPRFSSFFIQDACVPFIIRYIVETRLVSLSSFEINKLIFEMKWKKIMWPLRKLCDIKQKTKKIYVSAKEKGTKPNLSVYHLSCVWKKG